MPNVNSENFGISSIRYMAAKVWDVVPNDMNNVNDTETFKHNIRKWKPVNCHCKLCLDYVSCVGFLTHYNQFQCSICWETGWLVFTSGVWNVALAEEFFAVETGYLVSLYISNFMFYFIYNFIISFNFHSNFDMFLRNIGGYLGLLWSLERDFLWIRLRLVA